ncbi:MAG TPA: UDP-N-acetylglucosamine 2-epimerase (hydrolyzing), partial [Firmicutes bacterium]|nr:UDP-N-acetylglucosamine 2-epimerase (hydrolyzing) [Bacillota bacterium]
MKKRKICVITGTRSEYGLLKNIMKGIAKSETLLLQTVIAGMHISKEFGLTKKIVIEDRFKISGEVPMIPRDDTPFSMSVSVGKGIIGFSEVFRTLTPDMILILGDRTEALAACIAGEYMNIPVAHIHGGDRTKAGHDESSRHAITKFAHLHFPATSESAERIRKLGEAPWRIFTVGAPGLDDIINSKLLSRKEIEAMFKLNEGEAYLLVVQHSVSTQPENSEEEITRTLESALKFNLKTIAIYPNSDSGGRKIIKKLKEYAKCYGNIKLIKSLDRKVFLSLLKYCKVLIGNSSSGIIEAASFSTPVVNIGIRQFGRERNENVLDVKSEKVEIY